MKEGDYKDYIGKHVKSSMFNFSSFGKCGTVTKTDSYGWLTVDWDEPDEKHGSQGLLHVTEITEVRA